MNTTTKNTSSFPDFSSPAAKRHRKRRDITDALTKYLMAFGGVSVIGAIVLIAFYLLYVVLPMFKSAHIELIKEYTVPGSQQTSLYYAMEEQREVALRVGEDGELTFFKAANGEVILQNTLFEDSSNAITAFSNGDASQALLAFGFDNGSVSLIQHHYEVTYPNDQRLITPSFLFPFGEEPIQIADDTKAIEIVSAQYDEEQVTIAAVAGNTVYLKGLLKEENMLSDEVEITEVSSYLEIQQKPTHILIDVEQRELYVVRIDGKVEYYDISDIEKPNLVDQVTLVPNEVNISSIEFLSGGISILVGDSRGRITQWFPVRDENNDYSLKEIRYFDEQDSAIQKIAPEYFRKGFAAIDKDGYLSIYHTTAHRVVKSEKIAQDSPLSLAISPRANALLIEKADKSLQYWHVDNEHPEVSWNSIWGKVWYESRDKPEYIWQSSSASSDFEPKFSLTPLAFGTLKAAFYAMLFAVPMAICGAIYTAYFMSPQMRGFVKPTIEIMEALPTVILGFLAGLWFAPFVEMHMPGLFILLFVLPSVTFLASYLWHKTPDSIRLTIPDGWESALLIPVFIIAIFISINISQPIEAALFDGNMPFWITNNLGLDFDQRNSLVVGIAMGFAVIPTIFSISEDAIYSVPKQLTTGSLALGATRWQTMVRVVLLTASPGIFSAIMIGLGRAVGETMIVVMATGNTAIMDMNIFEGFRALSANIAVEMPESEVDSTHYRILFLAGLVLFVATFAFNTIAELVRQRLRVKYSTL